MYSLANTVIQVPAMIALSVMAIALGGYGISNYHAAQFLPMLGIYTLTIWSFECAAELQAIQFGNPLVGMLMFMNIWFSSFLFAGVMVPERDVIWPFRLFTYTLPLRWFLSGAMFIDFKDTTFSGAYPVATGRGYACPLEGVDDRVCYGYTGRQVLDSIGATYKSISSEDTVGMDCLYILIIGLVFKLSAVLLLQLKSLDTKEIVPAKKAA